MANDYPPRRGTDDPDDPRLPGSPSDVPDEQEDTAVRPAFRFGDPSWYRPEKPERPKSPVSPARAADPRDDWANVPFSTPKPGRANPTDAGSGAHVVNSPRRKSLRRSLLLTVASTVLPGSGLLGAPQRWLRLVGATTSVLALGVVAYLAYWASTNTAGLAAMAFETRFLTATSLTLIVVALVWAALIATTHIVTRPAGLRAGRRLLGAAVVTALCFGVAAPSALGARYSRDQTLLVTKVFGDDDEVTSTSRPTLATEARDDPWKDVPRVNVLLLGADGSAARTDEFSVRTDTIMVASIDTQTGDTLLVQIPRNVQYTPFPEDSELHDMFPRGFRGEPENDYFINSIWAHVELGYPDIHAGSTYRGAESLKEGVEGVTGLNIDYFAMLNIDGLQRLIDAMGGVTVNINQRLAIGGSEGGRRPSGYLEPGANQNLGGYDAMWYARSRLGYSDYDRMARQSCLVDAIITQANPATMLTRYEAIAAASSEMVVTDIPQRDLSAFVELAFRVKDAPVKRLVFSPGKNGYAFADPDFDAMRQAVEDAINPPTPSPVPTIVAPTSAAPSTTPATRSASSTPTPSASPTQVLQEGTQDVADACAWNGGVTTGEDEEG